MDKGTCNINFCKYKRWLEGISLNRASPGAGLPIKKTLITLAEGYFYRVIECPLVFHVFPSVFQSFKYFIYMCSLAHIALCMAIISILRPCMLI